MLQLRKATESRERTSLEEAYVARARSAIKNLLAPVLKRVRRPEGYERPIMNRENMVSGHRGHEFMDGYFDRIDRYFKDLKRHDLDELKDLTSLYFTARLLDRWDGDREGFKTLLNFLIDVT
ncbi:MAG: hypothetical protein OEY44_01740, partial [Candidatus Peregrinibacteria bacterium]|nr:hypothetical protein [Candidatus Peregrinibacteria bacterium]